MTMEIVAHGIALDPGVRLSIRRRLAFALGRFAPRIGQVRLQLSDPNGPRGGPDTLCRLEINGVRQWTAYLEVRGRDATTAVGHLAERAGRAVERSIKRDTEARLVRSRRRIRTYPRRST